MRELQQKVESDAFSVAKKLSQAASSYVSIEVLTRNPSLPQSVLCYLEPTRLRSSEHGLILEVPTQYHITALKRHESKLLEILGVSNLKFEVCESLTQSAASPSTPPPAVASVTAFKPRAVELPLSHARMPLPSKVSEQGALELEKTRRLQVPIFVQSPQFQTAFELAKRWAEVVNRSGNQILWVYGRSGSGKTHLLRQMHEWVDLKKRIQHVDAMNFFQEWRRALDAKDTFGFVRKYRKETDLLILENIDSLENKLRTQEEILITVNALMEKGANIAVSSVRSPASLRDSIEPSLFSRLFGGMIVEMPSPDRHFKENLWKLLMDQHGIKNWHVDPVVAERIFNIPMDTARGVHSLFVNAMAKLSLCGNLSLKEVSEIESRFIAREGPKIGFQSSPAEYVDKISRMCGLGMSAIQGNSRKQEITLARNFVCLALCRFLGMTNSSIAVLVNKDASTVSKALKSIEHEIEVDRHVGGQWAYICQQLGVSAAYEQSQTN